MHRSKTAFTSFVLHLHPKTVPQETLRFGLSFGLGGMAVTLLFLLFTTGLLQLLNYTPDIAQAYASVERLYSSIPLGGWVRNIHHWSANLLVVVLVLHVVRVMATGALIGERRLNWIIGLCLFFLILFANFSGYLLPWDQLAYWAITIFTSMMSYLPLIGPWLVDFLRGGQAVGPETLANFFAIHVGLLPVLVLLLVIYHFWLIRKAGGLIRQDRENGPAIERISVLPNLIVREAAVGLTLVAIVLLVAAMVDAPLGGVANPAMSPNPTKAAWYFLGLQELLLHMHPLFAVCIVPITTTLLLAILPFWQGAVLPAGQWFGGKREAAMLALSSFLAGVFLTAIAVGMDDFLFRRVQEAGGDNSLVFRGGLPFIVSIILLVLGYLLLRRLFNKSRAEAVMVGVAFHLSCIFSLTVIGIWFRGPGMQLLIWPF